MSQDSIVKTTAVWSETGEPDRRHRPPIIKIDERTNGRAATLTSADEALQLVNRIRASIDSGRDNPFRPDGEIYRMTDPIVDFYKLGPSQSRTATPTYAELGGGSASGKRKTATSKATSPLRFWQKRAPKSLETAEGQKSPVQAPVQAQAQAQVHVQVVPPPPPPVRPRRRSCWRKWLCCCCSCNKSSEPPAAEGRREQLDANIDYYNKTTATKSEDLITTTTTTTTTTNSKPTQLENNNNNNNGGKRAWQANGPSADSNWAAAERQQQQQAQFGAPTSTTNQSRIKVVILEAHPQSRGTVEVNTNGIRTANTTTNGDASGPAAVRARRPTTSRCIVS